MYVQRARHGQAKPCSTKKKNATRKKKTTHPESCASFSFCGTSVFHHSHSGPFVVVVFIARLPFDPPRTNLMSVPSRSNAATREDAHGARCTPWRQLRAGPSEGVSHLNACASVFPSLSPRFSKIGKTGRQSQKKIRASPPQACALGIVTGLCSGRTFWYLGIWLAVIPMRPRTAPRIVSLPFDERR